MKNFTERNIDCPHCGYNINLTLDKSIGNQSYFDECPACGYAIRVNIHFDSQKETLSLDADLGDDHYI